MLISKQELGIEMEKKFYVQCKMDYYCNDIQLRQLQNVSKRYRQLMQLGKDGLMKIKESKLDE